MIDKIEKQNEKQKKILEQLDRVEQPYRLILEKVYILGKSLEAVTVDLHYSYRQMKRKHAIALKKFEEAV